MWISSFSSPKPASQPGLFGVQPANRSTNPILNPLASDQVQFSGGQKGWQKKRKAEALANAAAANEASLLKAARRNDVAGIRQSLASGSSPDQTNSQGLSALMLAAQAGHVAAVNVLAENWNLINQQDLNGRTALHYAVIHNQVPVVEALARKYARSDIPDQDGHTAITKAAELEHLKALDWLTLDALDRVNFGISNSTPFVPSSVNPYAPNNRTRMPLMTAVEHDQVDAARMLLQRGALPDGPGESDDDLNTDFETSPLMKAVSRHNPAMIDLLIRHKANVDWTAFSGETALTQAVAAKHWESLKLLLAHGADQKPAKEALEELLYEAAKMETPEKLRRLLRLGIRTDQVERSTKEILYEALGKAAQSNDLITAQLLLKSGVSPTNLQVRSFVHPPLVLAAKHNHEEMVDLLLKNGADINATATSRIVLPSNCRIFESRGPTALHRAVENNNLLLVRKLLNKKANLESLDPHTRTPFTLAIAKGHNQLAKILYNEYQAKAEWDFKDTTVSITPLIAAASSGNEEMLDFLLDQGISVDQRNGMDSSALIEAKNASMALKLIDKGADVNLKNEEGTTPLSAHSMGNNIQVMQILLKKGADVNATAGLPLWKAVLNNNPQAVELLLRHGARLHNEHPYGTLLNVAVSAGKNVQNADQNTLDITKLLLAKGLPIDHRDSWEQTPFLLAAEGGKPKTLRYLLAQGANPNVKDQNDWTAFTHGMAEVDHRLKLGNKDNQDETLDLLKTLLEVFPEEAKKFYDHKVYSTLTSAIQAGYFKIVELLLAHGVDPKDPKRGHFLFELALQSGNLNAMLRLLQAGVDPVPEIQLEDQPVDPSEAAEAEAKPVDQYEAIKPDKRSPQAIKAEAEKNALEWPLKLTLPEVKAYLEAKLNAVRRLTWSV